MLKAAAEPTFFVYVFRLLLNQKRYIRAEASNMASKKIAAERRPFCDTRLQDTEYRRKRTLHVKRTLFVYESASKSGKRQLNDCPFFKLQYGFDELPLDPIKDFLLEKICTYF